MKILVADIETAPILAYTWGLRNQFISLNQIKKQPSIIGFAAKWVDKNRVEWYSDFHHSHDEMLAQLHRLLDEADAVVTYNGQSFDIPWIQGELAIAGYKPPSPFKQIDLYRAVKKQFRLPSYKLAHVTSVFGLSGKLSHTGFDMWTQCLEGDEKAWSLMRRYCKQDVVTTGELYETLLPWIPSLPNAALYVDEDADELTCPTPGCGSTGLQRRGYATTALGKYRRYQCVEGCGRWSRGKQSVKTADLRNA